MFVIIIFYDDCSDDQVIGLYRENAIAIESEARYPYVTMQITFPIPEFARKERNLHCDVVYITTKWVSIGLYRENAIAIQNESGDSNGGNVLYVTMRITFNIPEFTRNERNSHCDVLHIIPIRVARLVLDDAIAAIQTSR